jgi:pimeloyl-ACP methyl ester carboxylesterase
MVERVLLLPGASGAGSFWEPVARLLPDSWDKVCLDWPGLGDVPPDPRVASFDDLADLVLARMEVPVDVVAQSMGGVVAVQVALRRPELVRRLVLVATSGGVDLSDFGVHDWRPDYRESYPSAADWITDHRVVLGERLRTIRAPTLLLWGGSDTISPPAVGSYLEALLPRARLVVIPDGDHMFARDRAAEVAPHVLCHLTRESDD